MAQFDQTISVLPKRATGRWPVQPNLLTNTLSVLGAVFFSASAAYVLLASHLSLGPKVFASAAALLLLIFTIVIYALPHHPYVRFGYANLVTAVRAAITSIVAALVVFSLDIYWQATLPWVLVGLVVAALVLDGVDGYLARRLRQESTLGARFDMEIDALLIMVLSVAAMALGKAGWWVLLIGLLRYGFLIAQWAIPTLRGELPSSLRRKTVCVVQGLALCFVLTPFVTVPQSTAIAAIALGLLVYSFTVDTVYLFTHRASA
ncbi:CDP-alcohol phosphatidyltransferase family protein [Agrobacterium sp. ES01]|uniref:CDP-alcohol phosphatidyltransferase family protein n=1 Tax=Agrobacterium sp. ES01 TaxID=3420714 RepID=UPI003D0F9696